MGSERPMQVVLIILGFSMLVLTESGVGRG